MNSLYHKKPLVSFNSQNAKKYKLPLLPAIAFSNPFFVPFHHVISSPVASFKLLIFASKIWMGFTFLSGKFLPRCKSFQTLVPYKGTWHQPLLFVGCIFENMRKTFFGHIRTLIQNNILHTIMVKKKDFWNSCQVCIISLHRARTYFYLKKKIDHIIQCGMYILK